MISLIISSPDQAKRRGYIQKYCANLSIGPLDITVIEKDSLRDASLSIGIEDIKNMQKKLYFKPLKSATKVVILEEADFLTTEAQNALLKVLEEPPMHTIIILSARNKEHFLPTIISRCQIIELKNETQKLSDQKIKELTGCIENIAKMPIGERLKKAEQISKNKDEAIAWTQEAILALREKLLLCHPNRVDRRTEGSHTTELLKPRYINHLKSLQKLHSLLKTTNVNIRFAIETTLLSI